MRKRTRAREYALQILYQYELNPENLQETMASFWAHLADVPEEIKQFAEKLVLGTHQNLKEIDEVIARSVENWKFNRIAVLDKNIMRFAVYELLYVEDIPPKVTLNEAVNLAKKFSQEDSGKFVNGVLDHINHSEKVHYSPPQHEKPLS